MEIVVLDGYTTNPGDQSWKPVRRLGELTVYDRTPESEIRPRAEGAEVLLTNKTPLRGDLLSDLEDLQLISVLATGYDNVDIRAARELGVPVANIPEYATDSVVEHTFALILELFHAVGMHGRDVRRGEWSKSPDFSFWNTQLRELSGKTIGIVGFGRIGRRVGRVASAFGMRVLGSTRNSEPSPDFGSFEHVETDEIFERADVVSLHCPLTDETEGLVGREALEAMKCDAVLVNTSRGEVVDEEALVEALESSATVGEPDVIAGAALDVVSEEPIPAGHPLLEAPNCLMTPHNAWASVEARERLIETTAENIEAFASGAPVNVVNGG